MFDGKYEYDENEINEIIDERGNMFTAVRKIRWKDTADFKLDIRNYVSTEGGEIARKGLSFLTEEGPGELINCLLRNNYGDTTEVADNLYENRQDICDRIVKLMNGEEKITKEEANSDDFYDPREIDLT